MLDDLIKAMKGNKPISIPRYRISADQMPFLEFLSMVYYTDKLCTDKDWETAVSFFSRVNGGSQHCLTHYKGKR